MDKTALISVLFVVSLWKVESASKFCRVSSDCVEGKRCCEKVCLSRKACNGICFSDSDCDKDYGESCTLGKCQCVQPPCTRETINEKASKNCIDDSECYKNETCRDGVCQGLDSISKAKTMNSAVLGVVATVGLIIFAGAFYLCLKRQQSSRPSLATKQAHHQAMERARINEHSVIQANNANVEETRGHLKVKKHQNCGKRHKDSHKKPPITSPTSLIELSAIIEEDEISEMAS